MGHLRNAGNALAHAAASLLGAVGVRRWLLRRPLPPRHEALRVAGCQAAVEVRLDTWGVPHIYADSAADLFFAQGYCHARDRLWQMELNRRVARGELAELIGEKALPLDRINRRLGFRRGAEREEAALATDQRAVLTAYAAGVNAWLAHHPPPVEYRLLRHTPRPWTATDTLAFARALAWNLSMGWESKLIRARLRGVLPAHRADQLLGAAFGISGGASNNWAVAPTLSETGRPLLANDPHLRTRLPATWYVAHLHGGGFNVVGATIPGLIGVLVGHNEHVAWSVTVAATDVQDIYLEKRHPERPRSFAHGSEWIDAEVRSETFAVRDQPPVVEEIVCTRHGPLLNGILGVPEDGPALSLRSITDDGPSAIQGLLAMNRARDWSTFRTALRGWTMPGINFVVADTAGTIAWKLAGQVPLRPKSAGLVPVPGDDDAHEWQGVVPFDEMPERVNPSKGILATANSAPKGKCDHYLSNDFMDDSRRRRIVELLRARPRHTLASFAAMQADVVSLPAREITAKVCAVLAVKDHPALQCWQKWDGALTVDSVAATLYHVFRHELLEHAYRDLPADARAFILGQGISEPLGYLGSIFHSRASSQIVALVDELLAPKNDTGRAVVEQALRAAVAWLEQRCGQKAVRWEWGRHHRLTLAHPLGQAVPLLDRLLRLSRGPYPIGGDGDTIAQAGIDPWHPFNAACFTVSYRQILDVGAWDDGLFILPTGQSGHPGSPHYDDMVKPFRAGRYHRLLFSRPAVEAATAETIRLLPRSEREP